MPVSRLLKVALAAILSLAFLAGCGGDDDDDATTDDATEDTADDTAEESTDDSADGTTDDTADDSTDDTEPADEGTEEAGGEDVTEPVTTAYTTFFADFDVTYLEDGDNFGPEVIADLQQRLADAGGASTNVNTVTALDDADCATKGVTAPCAEVNYDLVVAGNADALPDQTGFAVYQDDTWKVANTTFCTLASLGGSTPEAC